MRKYNYIKFFTLFLIVQMMFIDMNAQSMLYVGGHFRRERPSTVKILKDSGFETVILFNIQVEPNGNLTTDGELICSNGEYVFDQVQPNYAQDVKDLVTGRTSITRVETCIGGWGSTSYDNIKSLINSQGTGSNSILYRNFKALIEAVPEMNIVNNDDEHGYDVTTASQFTIMLYDLGFKSTIAPYTYYSFWNSLESSVNKARPGAIERNYVQCYDGGAYNNPCDWKIGDVPVWAGKLNYDDKNSVNSIMTGWRDNCDVKGGFIWVFNDTGMSPSSWTSVINPIFESAGIQSYISVNNEEPVNTTYIKVLEGESVSLEPEYKEGNWSWKGPNGFTSNTNMVTLSDITIESGGNYIVKYIDQNGVDYTKNILVQVEKNAENSVASFYDNWDYYGSYEISLALGEYNSESLNSLGIGVNNITSVKVELGYGVVVYSEDNFLGDYTCITGDMSYLDNWNKRINSLKIIELPSGTGTGLKADYYSGNNFNVLKGSRIDESVNFDWGTGAPLAGMPVDNFSIRWSGKIEPLFTATYTFYITSDNSRRLWINNELIIDKWINDWDIEYSGSIDLEAGKKYDIKLDYCEYEGGANIKFHWSSDMQMKEIVPTKQLYPEDQINGLGDMTHTNSDLKLWPTVVKDGILNVRFENEAKLSGCNYSIFNIHGSLVDNGKITQNGQITLKTLTAGMYIIQITNSEKSYIHKIIIK